MPRQGGESCVGHSPDADALGPSKPALIECWLSIGKLVSVAGRLPWMSRIVPVVTVIAALLAAAPAGAAHRATTDLPDDFRGPQIHLVYAIPSDGPDRGLDTGGNIAQTAANFSAWLRGQTGGRSLRYDTASGAMWARSRFPPHI